MNARTDSKKRRKKPEWKSEEVFHDSDLFFRRLKEEIGSARSTIDLETYIFDRDQLGESVLKALVAAAKRGVRVRLLLDGFGCWQWNLAQLESLERQGLHLRVYHPLPWQNRSYSLYRSLSLRRIFLGLFKLNRRNHRKVCVIDRRRAFVGGMNISARQLRSASGSAALRDTSVVVEGKGVSTLTSGFERAWRQHRSFRQRVQDFFPPSARAGLVRLKRTRLERRLSYAELLQRILGAENRVWLASPYFVPDIALVRAMRFAAWSGVEVRLLIPRDNKVWGFKWAAKAYYFLLLAAGVRIFEYRPSLLHAKIVLIDQWAKVGSSNLNHRSLLHDLEVDVVLTHPASLAALETQYLLDLEESTEIKFQAWKKRALSHRLFQKIALIFRRWL